MRYEQDLAKGRENIFQSPVHNGLMERQMEGQTDHLRAVPQSVFYISYSNLTFIRNIHLNAKYDMNSESNISMQKLSSPLIHVLNN